MKNIKDILLEKLCHQQVNEKLVINKNIKSYPSEYEFKLNSLEFKIKVPFSFNIIPLNQSIEIIKIEKQKNEFNEEVWSFYFNYDDNEWRFVTLNANGVYNVFIRGKIQNKKMKCEPLLFYGPEAKHIGKRMEIEVDNIYDVIKESIDEKLIINKNIKSNEIYWFTNNKGIKLPFELTLPELHEKITITNIEHSKPIGKDLWKLYDKDGNHVFTLYELVLKTLLFNNSNRKVAILRTFDNNLKQKSKYTDKIVVRYKDDESKILMESIQESQETHKKYSNIILLNPNEDAILVLRRANYVKPFKGMWGFPGGHIDSKDKDAKATAIRELKEETGIELTFNEEHKCKKFDTITNNDGSISEYYMTTLETIPEIKLSREHAGYEWFNEKSTKNHKWMPDVFQIIQKIL